MDIKLNKKQKISSSDLASLHAFKKDYPLASCFMIYGGTTKQYIGNIAIIPFQEALITLPQLLAN